MDLFFPFGANTDDHRLSVRVTCFHCRLVET